MLFPTAISHAGLWGLSISAPLTLGSLLRSALLNDKLVQLELLRCSLKHSLFHRVLLSALQCLFAHFTHTRDEPEHVDLLGLSNSVCPVHCLQIGLRVPGVS